MATSGTSFLSGLLGSLGLNAQANYVATTNNTKTKVGAFISKVGSFFGNIFKKENTPNTPTTATPPIASNSGGWFSTLLVTIGLPALSVYLGSKGLINTGSSSTTQSDGTVDSPQSSGVSLGVIVGIVLIIIAIISFFVFRRK